MCIIIICSIQTLLSILRYLTQSCVTLLRMRIQFSKLLTNVGVYVLTYPKNTGILRYGTGSALWVLIRMVSNMDSFLTINGKDYSHKDVNLVRDFFTDEQWDLIDYALSEYQDHDDSTEKCKELLDVMYQVFRSAY
jgi:hypothetical protein